MSPSSKITTIFFRLPTFVYFDLKADTLNKIGKRPRETAAGR